MGKTEVINGFKVAGPLADARHVLIRAIHLIDEAERAGTPITRGDLIQRVCSEYHVFDSNYTWLGSPGPKSPIDKLYTREKQGKVFVMRMMEEGRQLLGKGLDYESLSTVKLHDDWERKGVFKVIKAGGIYKFENYNKESAGPVVVLDTHGKKGINIMDGNKTLDVHVIYLHDMDCPNTDPRGGRPGPFCECLNNQKKV